jgi:hypothetical protein
MRFMATTFIWERQYSLNREYPDDPAWQDYWRRLVVFPETFYNIPKGPTAKRFIGLLTKDLLGIRNRKWNSKRFRSLWLLKATEENFGFSSPRHQEKARMEDGCLVEKSILDACAGHGEHAWEDAYSKKQGMTTPEQQAKTFHQNVLKGDIPGAVRYIIDREMGGLLLLHLLMKYKLAPAD